LPRRYRNRQDLGFARDDAGDDESGEPSADHHAVGDDRAIEQEPLEFVLAPTAMEGRRVQLGHVAGVARRRFGHAGLLAREQIRDEIHHRRGSPAAVCGRASGARR
jgi:hypothetical protein